VLVVGPPLLQPTPNAATDSSAGAGGGGGGGAGGSGGGLRLSSRAVTVGRCKVEPRPLLIVSFACDDSIGANGGSSGSGGSDGGGGSGERVTGQLFLQQAETVRLVRASIGGGGGDGDGAISVTALAPGDVILVRRSAQGTHVGRAISATVTEL
jgi:3-dehydroquinate synthase II